MLRSSTGARADVAPAGAAEMAAAAVTLADASHAMPATDREALLIARIAEGDRAALAELYARMGRPLLGYLLQLTPDRELAEELLQDTLLAIWTAAGTFAARSPARTWLFGIARRQAHNTLRRRGLPLAAQDEGDGLALLADPAQGPEDLALARAGGAEMAAALARLAVAHREILLLAVVHGLPQQELAELLGVPLGTVKSRLHTAKRALRALLAADADKEGR